MYLSHWGLDKTPFPTGTAESVFYLGIPQQEALARLRFLVHNQRRLGLMLGESGSGKSLVLTYFAEEAQRHLWHVAHLNLVNHNVREFHWQLALALGAAPRMGDDMPRLLRRCEDRLRANQLQEETTVLLLDDADQAGVDLLPVLLRLVQSPASRVGALTIVLATQAGQESRLGARLLECVDLKVEVEPWGPDDTSGFLQTALVEAGALEPLFDDAAIEELHQLSAGIPRHVTRLADYALLVASSMKLEQVDAATVAEAHAALGASRVQAGAC